MNSSRASGRHVIVSEGRAGCLLAEKRTTENRYENVEHDGYAEVVKRKIADNFRETTEYGTVVWQTKNAIKYFRPLARRMKRVRYNFPRYVKSTGLYNYRE